MARAVERIEQDLAALEDAIALLRVELHSAYSQYLKLLGQAVRQQLIVTSYQVCTQGYPESFLSLSFSQRQNFQQALRELGGKSQAELLSHLDGADNSVQSSSADEPELPPVTHESSQEPELPLVTHEVLQEPEPEPPLPLVDVPVLSDSPETVPPTAKLTEPSKPAQLVKWQEQLEEAIAKTFQTLSLETNRLLQQTGILPKKLPATVLEAAAQVEASGDLAPGSPNLLNLLMETESEGEKEDSTLTRIVAINLRLPEIEFADPALTAGRNQIRKLAAKVNTLGREYHKCQRERSVAQAEAAWRSSWLDN